MSGGAAKADVPAYYPTADMRSSAWVFLMLAVMESGVLHILMWALGHGAVLLVLTGLADAGLVGAVWVIDSLGRRPTTIAGAQVTVQVGVLFRLAFPAEQVDLTGSVMTGARMLNGALLANPNLVLVFRSPCEVTVLGLLRRPVDGIRLKLDGADDFLARLRAAG